MSVEAYANISNTEQKTSAVIKIDNISKTKEAGSETNSLESNSVKISPRPAQDRQSVADLINEHKGETGLKLDISI